MRTFTLSEINEAWSAYEKERVLRVQINGEWKTLPVNSMRGPIAGTHAQLKDLSDVMDFPEYLEKLWKK